MEKVTFSLTKKESDLLFLVLEELAQERRKMGCNDPGRNEEEIFTKSELKKMSKAVGNPRNLFDYGFLFNFQYVDYLLNKLKQQNSKI